jgi:YebC/PmpR family DNA-binding regulatory protein
MSGHSKWATTKHKKAAADAKRGKIFTKIIREMTVAARLGGGNSDGNPRLRLAIAKAKEVNMPADNIKRAIQKGTGELPGVSYEEFTVEGYGPGGVALLIEVQSDNKNRTLPEIRHSLTKFGGNMGENGCVAWMFNRKGLISVDRSAGSEEKILEVVLEAGAEDMQTAGKSYDIRTAPDQLESMKEALDSRGIAVLSAEVTMVPQSAVPLEGKTAETMLKLMEELEDHDDIQNVYANFDIPDEILENV